MQMDFTIQTQRRDKETGQVKTNVCSLMEYTSKYQAMIMSLLNDVENMLVEAQGGKEKFEWSEDVLQMFQTFRKKTLNAANSVGRIPEALHYKNVPCNNVSMSEFIASIVDRK